jgi:hypothetical protein
MTSPHQTYELYLDDGGDAPRFEALTCPSPIDLLPAVRRLIEQRKLQAVEVRCAGVPLFTVHA